MRGCWKGKTARQRLRFDSIKWKIFHGSSNIGGGVCGVFIRFLRVNNFDGLRWWRRGCIKWVIEKMYADFDLFTLLLWRITHVLRFYWNFTSCMMRMEQIPDDNLNNKKLTRDVKEFNKFLLNQSINQTLSQLKCILKCLFVLYACQLDSIATAAAQKKHLLNSILRYCENLTRL